MHNCLKNWTLSLLFWRFITTAAYHLGKYEPSSLPTKELHGHSIGPSIDKKAEIVKYLWMPSSGCTSSSSRTPRRRWCSRAPFAWTTARSLGRGPSRLRSWPWTDSSGRTSGRSSPGRAHRSSRNAGADVFGPSAGFESHLKGQKIHFSLRPKVE